MTVEDQILVLAPLWRDTEVVCHMLDAAGLSSQPCSDMHDLCERLAFGAAALLVTEEALGVSSHALLLEALQKQDSWSDLPVTILLSPSSASRGPLEARALLPGSNVTVLRRPVPSSTLVSVLNAALRARRRQYEVRAHLRERENRATELERRVRQRTKKLQEVSEQYRATRDLFFTLFHANPLPIAINRLNDGRFLDVNESFLRHFGARRDQFVDRTIYEANIWLPDSERERIVSLLRKTGSVQNIEMQTTGPNGEHKTALINIEIVHIDGVKAAISTFLDITERKQAAEQIHQLASQLTRAEHEERHRISQILHDDLQQQLYGMQIQLSFLNTMNAGPDLREEIQEMKQLVEVAIETTRRLSVDLSPPILYGEGLAEGLAWIIGRVREQYRIDVDLEADGSFPIADDGRRVLLFQVVRELLFNAVKHAKVSRIKVVIQQVAQSYRIDVLDEGAGFDPEQVLQGQALPVGQGLAHARERLRLIGGHMELESAPGKGTRVSIYAPVDGSSPHE